MTQKNRLAGGQIDRQTTLKFTFDGTQYEGHQGDTLASALLANNVRLMGRSFKYHRSRCAAARVRNPTPAPPRRSCSTG